jgi:hypothetical protein
MFDIPAIAFHLFLKRCNSVEMAKFFISAGLDRILDDENSFLTLRTPKW